VSATDINEPVLAIARQKSFPKGNVTFGIADFYEMDKDARFDSLFGGFIFSHIRVQEIGSFLEKIGGLIADSGMVVLMDNNYVEGSSIYRISHRDEQGNGYQTRPLDGIDYLVLKNYPTEDFVREKLSQVATGIKFINLKYYWMVSYTIK
jgi:hypothetical protein